MGVHQSSSLIIPVTMFAFTSMEVEHLTQSTETCEFIQKAKLISTSEYKKHIKTIEWSSKSKVSLIR